MKKLKFLLPDKNWSDIMDITVIRNYGYNGYKGYNSYKGYNRYTVRAPLQPALDQKPLSNINRGF